MKITDLRCAVIGKHPIVRIVTDEGVHGLGEAEYTKPYLKPWVLHFREALIGEDPTDVERVMLKIRQRGSFKPYGAAVSAIEHALWDIAGKAAGVPVYKLLGGKVRDKVRVYNGSIRRKRTGDRPEDYAADVKWMMEQPENFFMIKQGISFHSNMKVNVPDFHYGVSQPQTYHGAMDQGQISERGMAHMIECVARHEGGARRQGVARARLRSGLVPARCDPFCESRREIQSDVAGRHADWRLRAMGQSASLSRTDHLDIDTRSTRASRFISRHNFKELIETQAVRVIGPDPADIGGIAELKWVAEHAYMHSIMMAPHGTANGLLGLGALINVCATLPANYIAFEYPSASDPWWNDIVIGLPKGRIVKDSMVDLLEAPGLGLDIDAEGARKYLGQEDADFFA